MKYLKLFELFDNKLYKMITGDDYADDLRDTLDFDSKLIEKIKSRLSNDFTLQVRNLNNDGKIYLDITEDDMASHWEIWQVSDEWFMVEVLYDLDRDDQEGPGLEFYECDTFDGLLQLLEDHGVIN